MTEPTKEQVDKWREEFEELNKPHDYFKVKSGKYGSSIVQRMWRNYLAAKKSDFEEIKTLKEQLVKAEQLIEEKMVIDDCGFDPSCETKAELETIMRFNDYLACQYFSEKQNQNKEKKE